VTLLDDFDGLDENSDERIRPEMQNLIRRGNVTVTELADLRCNSWEWEALVPALSDEAFVERMQYALDNCFTRRERPFSTYNQAVEGLYAPELLRRFKFSARDARVFAETIDDVREALGQKATHYLVIADDVKELVEAIESRCDALVVLKRLRGEGATHATRCQACSIEAEIGTEENPHPVPSRFHTCPPTYLNAVAGVHIFPSELSVTSLYVRDSDGNINNCALANGDERKNCQMCSEQCPDRARFEVKP